MEEVLKFFNKMGGDNTIRHLNSQVLTVLNYHRVDDITRPGFDSFTPNVTASPNEFDYQMEYVQRHYNVITCKQLAAWLCNEQKLPPHSALITFDDGYYDNYAYAYPILKKRNLPAVIFLSTNYIENSHPFYWDYVSYCFKHSRKHTARLPLQETVSWTGEAEQKKIMKQWINRIKQLSETERQRAVAGIAEILDVVVPEGAFSGLYLSWDQVREMSNNGIEMGSHTAGHPILTRIPLSQVEDELVRSKQKIESEIEKPVIGLAYPNGRRSDFSPDVENLAQRAGYKLAFSLIGGATSYAEVKTRPYSIQRIFLSSSDTFPRFVTKLVLGRFISNFKDLWTKKHR